MAFYVTKIEELEVSELSELLDLIKQSYRLIEHMDLCFYEKCAQNRILCDQN